MIRLPSIVTIAASYAPRAYSPGVLAPVPTLAQHEFTATYDGQLEHWIDGRLRATVPPEGLAEYADTWPAAGELVALLLDADH